MTTRDPSYPTTTAPLMANASRRVGGAAAGADGLGVSPDPDGFDAAADATPSSPPPCGPPSSVEAVEIRVDPVAGEAEQGRRHSAVSLGGHHHRPSAHLSREPSVPPDTGTRSE